MKRFLNAALLLSLVPGSAIAQVNAGTQAPENTLPFTITKVADFKLPWRIAFLPDGRMLVTEKVGPIWLMTQKGEKTPVDNVPAVLYQGQGGMLGVFTSPKYATDHNVYLTYSEPGEAQGTSGLALARAKLTIGESTASLDGLQVIWRQLPKGRGGQFGALECGLEEGTAGADELEGVVRLARADPGLLVAEDAEPRRWTLPGTSASARTGTTRTNSRR